MHASVHGVHDRLGRLGGALRTRRRALLCGAVAGALALTTGGATAFSRDAAIAPAGAVAGASAVADDPAALQQSANNLLVRSGGNMQALVDAGQAALRGGRNDATIAAMLRLRWVGRLEAGLERHGAGLASGDRARLALAVAGVQHYSELIHNALLAGGPDRLITVSLHDQRLVAYERGQPVVDTLVTTGRPSLPTDIGEMRVLKKDSPWTMQSPWPKGSPNWYPDTQVQMVLWFTTNGEGLHDASWQPAGTYGPGSTDGPFASHGCIHVPRAAEATLFNWATLGTPVVVYPGDGTALAAQTSHESVDAAGNPITGTRGA